MLWVTGKATTIIENLSLKIDDEISRLPINLDTFNYSTYRDDVPSGRRFVLCAGVLYPKGILDQSIEEVFTNVSVNMTATIALAEAILEKNRGARIVILGSASGFKGSYDTVYAAAKAGLHQYIINKKLFPEQQLVGIAPAIIKNSGMTSRRTDLDVLNKRELLHPKKRFLAAEEVANLIQFLLYKDYGYITNTVINMTGGEVRV